METISTYEQQANDFLTKTGTAIEINYKKFDYHFQDDKDKRDVYSICINRGTRSMSFDFGQSLNNSGLRVRNKNNNKITHTISMDAFIDKDGKINISKFKFNLPYPLGSFEEILKPKAPTNYDILACLTKYDPNTFEDFCSEFGYDEDSRKALKVYEAVKKEFTDLCTLFNDEELTELAEIQ